MVIALIKLPVALERETFNLLASKFDCIKEAKGKRVYEEINYEPTIGGEEVRIYEMPDSHYYEDECHLENGKYYVDSNEIDKYYVHKYPTKDYAVLKERVVMVDLEDFYSVVSDVSVLVIRVINI